MIRIRIVAAATHTQNELRVNCPRRERFQQAGPYRPDRFPPGAVLGRSGHVLDRHALESQAARRINEIAPHPRRAISDAAIACSHPGLALELTNALEDVSGHEPQRHDHTDSVIEPIEEISDHRHGVGGRAIRCRSIPAWYPGGELGG